MRARRYRPTESVVKWSVWDKTQNWKFYNNQRVTQAAALLAEVEKRVCPEFLPIRSLSPPQQLWLKRGEKICQQLPWNKTSRLAAYFNFRMLNSLTWILCFPHLYQVFIKLLYKNMTKTVALQFIFRCISSSVTAAWIVCVCPCVFSCVCFQWYSSFFQKNEKKEDFSPLLSWLWLFQSQPPDAIGTPSIHQRGTRDGEGCPESLDRQPLKFEIQGETGRVRGGEKGVTD